MRVGLVFLIFLLMGASAHAQGARDIAGFVVGMSEQDARAAEPGLRWPRQGSRPWFSVSVPPRAFERVDLPLHLVFAEGELDYIGAGNNLLGDSAEACTQYLEQVVTSLESRFGALNGATPVVASGFTRMVTAGGSIIDRSASRSDEEFCARARLDSGASVFVSLWAIPLAQSLWDCDINMGVSHAIQPLESLPEPTVRPGAIEWLELPVGRDFERYYPLEAMRLSRPGNAVLTCTIGEDGRLACVLSQENPDAWGFGEAALAISRSFRAAPLTRDGAPTAGQTVRIPISFRTDF